MFSGAVPGLNSVHSPEEELLCQIPASLQALLNFPSQFPSVKSYWTSKTSFFNLNPSYLRRAWSESGVPRQPHEVVVWIIVAVIFAAASFAWLVHSKKTRKYKSLTEEAIMESPNSHSDGGQERRKGIQLLLYQKDPIIAPKDPSPQVLFAGNQSEIQLLSDEKYAEELQVQEALLASLLASQIATNASASAIQSKAILDPIPVKIANEIGESSQSFCKICLESKESWQMFRNESCAHSFCYGCTSSHIVAKIQNSADTIRCPGVNCKAVLASDACRLMIPKDALVRWDESLCKSLIDESQTLFCPYRDCSAMLVNDSGEIFREATCPLCRRSFCACCRVPWHSEFTCKEFQKLSAKKKGGEDGMVKELAKKKKWQKCPRCKYYVEKAEGCLHITCRCGYEFCYLCGSKWSGSHRGRCRGSVGYA